MGTVSASKLSLLQKCQLWPTLPHADDPPGEAALTGTALHAMIGAEISGEAPPTPPEGADVDAARTGFGAWRDWWRTSKQAADLGRLWTAELPYAYDPATGEARELPTGGHRAYEGLRPGEIAGTADLVGRDGDAVVVGDWKGGRAEYVEPATTNPQLAFLALCAARTAGVARARVFLAFVRPEGLTLDVAELDAMDLDGFEVELRAALDAIPTAEPRTGAHCRFCPARAACPATEKDAAAVAGEDASRALVRVTRGELATPEQLGAAYERLVVLEDVLRAARDRVRTEVDRLGAVPLPSGRRLRLVDVSRETLSRASVKRALGGDADGVLDMLRSRGAIETTQSRQLREGR